MSNEITAVSQLTVANANLNAASSPSLSSTPAKTQINQSVQAVDSHIVTLTAGSDTAITIAAAVTTLGWCWFQNLDATNYVQWGPNNAGAINVMGRMMPGEPAGPFRLEPGITFRMKAHTGDCNVQIFVLAN